MTADRVRLSTPQGKPWWLVYGIRRICDGTMVYIGRTKLPLWARWCTHGLNAYHGRKGHQSGFLLAIREGGLFAFCPEELACCLSERDAAWTEDYLITIYDTLHPNGLNAASAIKGGKRSADFDARHRAACRAGYANWTPTERKNHAALCAANGEITRLRWEDPDYRAANLPRVRKAAEAARAAHQLVWADPEKRPIRAANLRAAREARVHHRSGSIRDARQKKLL